MDAYGNRLWKPCAVFAVAFVVAALMPVALAPKPAEAAHPGTPGRVVFTSDRDGDNEIFTMDRDGSDVVKVTDNAYNDADPTFGPGGELIAFSSDRDGNPEIYVSKEDGSGPLRLTNSDAADTEPAWSNNGMEVAFTRSPPGEDSEIYEIVANTPEGSTDDDGYTAAPDRLTDNAYPDARPSYSPSGDMAFDRSISGQNRLEAAPIGWIHLILDSAQCD